MRRLAALSALVVLVACGDDGPPDELRGTAVDDRQTGEVRVEVVADGFDGPTQLALAPDGRLLVAELNGGERDGDGRVVAVDLTDPSRRDVLADGLLTPTGVAAQDDQLWIMERRRLTVGPLDAPDERRVVLDELPYNGRSEGTLTPLADGAILFDTSGSREGDRLVAGSGTLWRLASPDANPEPYATGFKHAYAHAPSGDGRFWVTEMSDGRLDGAVPPDELVLAAAGDDFGYPRCVGDRTPVLELGASDATCASTPRSHALFAPGATPTSVVVAPWDPDTLLVALWNRGEIVAVPASSEGRPHDGVVVVAELIRPQHLLVDGDRVLVTDHASGRVLGLSIG